jgi:hypothetical protein
LVRHLQLEIRDERSGMDGGIRPGIWIAALLVLAGAIGVVRLALPGYGEKPHRQPTRVASPDRSQTTEASGAVGVHPAAALLPAPSASSREQVAGRANATAPPAPAEPLAQQGPTREGGSRALLRRVDSRVASDLRIVEDEAAQRAAELGIAVPPVAQAPASVSGSAAESTPTAEDAHRAAAADAVLVQYLMEDAYRGTEFPTGYPAEEVTRSAAESTVSGLSPEMRQSMLQVALQTLGPDRIGPRFDPYQIWEGSILPR